jgi:hypothetical protein
MKKYINTLLVSSLIVGSTQAAVVSWDFEGASITTNQNTTTTGVAQGPASGSTSVPTSYGANTFASGVTVGNFMIGSTDRGTDVTDQSHSNHSPTVSYGSQFATIGRDRDNTNIMSFTVTVDAATTVNFTNLAFDYGFADFSGVSGTNYVNPNYTLSVDGGGSFATSFGSLGDQTNKTNGVNVSSFSTGISGLSAVTNTTLTFTWTLDDANNRVHAERRHLMDNIVLTGTVVPEPSAALLGAFGILGLLHRRRNH